MAKVNIIAALNQIAIETPRNYSLYKADRIYQGFKIARYPQSALRTMTVPCEWIARYENAGGNYDSCGCWGFTLSAIQEFYDKGFNPESLGLIGKLWGRVDFTNAEEFCQLHTDYGFTTEKQYHALMAGKSRVRQMELAGIEWTKCYWSALKIKNFSQWMAVRQTTFREHQFQYSASQNLLREEGGFFIETIAEYEDNDSYLPEHEIKYEVSKCSSVFCKSFRDAIKYSVRYAVKCKTDEAGYANRSSYTFKSVKAFCYSAKTRKSVQTAYYGNHRAINTSAGSIYTVGTQLIVVPMKGYYPTGEFHFIKARNVAGVNVAKVNDTVFAWTESFTEHIEAPTVKEAVTKLLKIKKVKGGTLCLNDVRNDKSGTAGYCLAGTQSFARYRMPFLYRMIKDYNSWGEVPADIMELEFSPLPYVWEGYRNPTV